MSLQALSDYTAVSKYAKWIKSEKRRETWDDTVNRSKQMMLEKFNDHEDIEEEYEFVRNKDVLASQRCMQFGGKPIIQHNTRLYNCAASYCDRLRFFQEFYYILLCGTGAGFSVQLHHVDKLPNFTKKRLSGVKLPKKKVVVDDSIEGWADTAGMMLSSYFENPTFPDYYNCNIEFDFSKIRKKGTELSFGIGKAPGPTPLRMAMEKIQNKLNRTIEKKAKRLWSINAYDIGMYLADSVISGGVRRAATIALFSIEDELMMKAKTGNWYHRYPHRARSNNSVMLLRDKVNYEEFSKIFDYTKQFGEPGFVWVDDLENVFNPCLEIGFDTKLYVERNSVQLKELMKDYKGPLYDRGDNFIGLSGWGFCNLTTLNGRTIKNKEDFLKRCEIAARIGTRQASFTNFPYLGRVTEEICRSEALLGVAIGGMMHNPEILLDGETQREGAKVVNETNEKYAKRFGINPSARQTCEKPDGNSSCLMAANPGIIPCHSELHFRNVQVNKEEHPYKFFKEHNPLACEESKWSQGKTDDIIRFPIKITNKNALYKHEVSGVELLKHIKNTYINWILPGTIRERGLSDKVTHNVSNTVHVHDNEWESVKTMLYKDRQFFGGVSFIPFTGDLDYAQAPYTTVYTKEQILEKYKINNNYYEKLSEIVKSSSDLWDDCECLLGNKTKDAPASLILLTRESEKYCKDIGILREFIYLVKNIWLWEKWIIITENWKEVDYSQMKETSSDLELGNEIACVGGLCERI